MKFLSYFFNFLFIIDNYNFILNNFRVKLCKKLYIIIFYIFGKNELIFMFDKVFFCVLNKKIILF